MFDDDTFNEFMSHEQFIAADVPCPWCGIVFELKVEDGQTNVKYRCSQCRRCFSMDWVSRQVTRATDAH